MAGEERNGRDSLTDLHGGAALVIVEANEHAEGVLTRARRGEALYLAVLRARRRCLRHGAFVALGRGAETVKDANVGRRTAVTDTSPVRHDPQAKQVVLQHSDFRKRTCQSCAR